MMMTIDTREQRTGRRTTRMLEYSPGDMAVRLRENWPITYWIPFREMLYGVNSSPQTSTLLVP